MKNKLELASLLLFVVVSTFAQTIKTNVIPQPNEVKLLEGSFNLSPKAVYLQKMRIVTDKCNNGNAKYLQQSLIKCFKAPMKIAKNGKDGIVLKCDKMLHQHLGIEGYLLNITNRNIEITAATEKGVFYGIQSLLQLIEANSQTLLLKAMSIKDKPRFEWRSFMLDESRYFKGEQEVKRILDQMAMLKMNIFHWHLTDDQGWRIEIKKYPKLTEVGAWRSNSQIGGWDSKERSGEPHGGFYTQKQIKNIVAYAEKRNITIVPEIEMPGHASAAIAAYPWLGTIGKLKVVPVVFGKMEDCYNVANPHVYRFLENVLQEVMELFPSKVVHIGGDEVKFNAWKNSPSVQDFMTKNNLKTPADLQIYFTNKISNYISDNDHIMMGWNEILGDNVHEWQKSADVQTKEKLATNTLVQFWKGNPKLITKAAKNGYDIVNSYHIYTYLDYSYKYTPLEKAYGFEPVPDELEEEFHNKILGLSCQMWGEWIPTPEDMNKMMYPRIAAFAEVGWTNKERKNYKQFRSNLNFLIELWKEQGIEAATQFEKHNFKEKE